MSKPRLIIVAMLFLTSVFSCNDRSAKERPDLSLSFKIIVKNPTKQVRKDAMVRINLADIKAKYPDFNPDAWVIFAGETEIPSQLNAEKTEILFVTDFAPSEKKTFTIHYAKEGTITHNYPKRTQAELSHKVGGRFVNRVYEGGEFQNVKYLRVPPEHTDHSLFIRYEGPGWESDKVGYRFYLDWRNAIDVFGKKVPDMVLQEIGQDDFESYHSMCPWGMDVLKVGESLGLGTLGMWYENKAERVAVTDSIICEIYRTACLNRASALVIMAGKSEVKI